MKLRTVLSALGVLAVLATPLLAQPILPPFNYDFEMEVQCTASATTPCPLVGPFTNLSGDFQDWISDSGGTTSNPTGPQTTDHNPGTSTGKYLYIESSLPTAVGSDALLLSPLFDLTGVMNPQISFWYHMLGAGMGTMHLDLVERLNEGTDAITTTGASFTTAGPSAAFVPAHVGTQITISGSTLGNDGVYTIMTVLGPNAVDVTPPFVMAEAGLTYVHEATTQDVIPAWQDDVDLWQQQVWLVSGLIGGGNSNSFQVIIRSFAGPVAPLTGSTFLSDMAIDDFDYIDLPDNDVGVVSIDAPGSLVAAGFQTVSVTIKNFGGLPQTVIPVSFDVDMGTPISETYMGSSHPAPPTPSPS